MGCCMFVPTLNSLDPSMAKGALVYTLEEMDPMLDP